MKRKDLKLDKYNISPEKYRELKYFCKQYEEKKANIQYGITAINQDKSGASDGIGSPTEAQALRNERYLKEVELIEQTAIEVDSELKEYIIKAVTQDLTYEYLNVPCGRRQFYTKRRQFFYLLSQKR